MRQISVDIETYSDVDIKKAGRTNTPFRRTLRFCSSPGPWRTAPCNAST